MRRIEADMKPGNISIRSCETGRREVFFHRKVGELHHPGIAVTDNGDQTGTRRKYGLLLIVPSLVLLQFWNALFTRRLEIERQEFCELLNTKRSDSRSKAM